MSADLEGRNGHSSDAIDRAVRRLERALVDFGLFEDKGGRPVDCGAQIAGPPEHVITAAAQSLYRARRKRDRYFDMLERDLGEPVWDILLDLFVAGRQGRLVSISSSCVAAAVPATTALRWIQHLEDKTLVIREPDPSDRRRANLSLSKSMAAAMEGYISDLVSGAGTGWPIAAVSTAKARA